MNYQITKNQHYVPQCLLKHFSYLQKSKKKINIFDITKASVRYNQQLTKVFSQNYFYDKDNSVETILSDKIESPASTIIDEIVKDDFSILSSPENWIHLLKFISTLIHRTPEAEEKLLSFIQTNFQSFAKELLRLNNFPSEASPPFINFESRDGFVSLITLQARGNAS